MSGTVQKISELIKDDLSLERIREIKEQLLNQKSTIEYQLNKESEKYYGYIQDSLNLLNTSQKVLGSMRDRMQDVNKLSDENKTSIERYEVISDATKLYEMISNTSTIYDKIVKFGSIVDQLNNALDEELSQEVIDSGCPYLLQIHYLLTLARDFQDQMTVMARVSTDDVQRTVAKLFGGLTEVINKFDQLLENIIYDIVEIARSDQTSLAVRFFKVINIEEKEDLKIIAIRNIIKKKEMEAEKSSMKKLPNSTNTARLMGNKNLTEADYPTYYGLYQEILNGTISTRTLPRGYKNFFFNKMKQSIQDMFVEVRETYQGDKKFDILNESDWIFRELLVVKEKLALCGPEPWNLVSKVFEFFYEELHILITELVESEPETIVILDILHFDKTFKKTLIDVLGFKKSEAKSIIGDEQKEALFKDYSNLLVVKMTEWFKNLEKAEFEAFLERTIPPHTDPDGLLFLDGTKTCFQMFTQQVEVAAGSQQAKILTGVIEKFVDLLINRQQHWSSIIDKEVDKILKYNELYDIDPANIPPEADVPGGLVEYLIATANDQMRAADYSVAISHKYGEMVSKMYSKEISNNIERALDGFADVVRSCTSGLLSIIFDDLKTPYSEIFSKAWYNGSQVQQITDTLYEYLVDIKGQMSPVVFILFIGSVIDETFFNFVQALNFEHSFKSKNNKFLEAMKRDFELFFSLFTKFITEDQKVEVIDRRFRVMEYFMDLTCEPVDEIVATWRDLILDYPETPIDFLDAVLTCRKDVDSSQRKHMIQMGMKYINSPERRAHLQQLTMDPSFISRFRLSKKSRKI
ncbi:hypothetical protein KAFR_0L01010 [Kazachstania africana CBS 2517]|uniref:Uncharacterized protein n=1 Tax=Kazachstania africana (strain ATCC 22294 / BCRC 22015 / CBS 2517 / CECT 1963 / NBRC 1671 / NRRL Y-8276) TaxID=1071382 RepID=H2B259_KAZAF|nr:hypothetical protein KAFR_0L01010 [Kazachstania africana CBS 2517]CCF60709.1 hypothetical protein KAFR_0L01010 [Kazachstania africana CBS 2517]